MKLIGLTGGIASGKSTIGGRLERLGAVRIDADQLARDAVAPGSEGLARVVERFGPGVLLPDGALDRPALGGLVFGDPAALADLNAIVHPEVRRLFDERLAEALAADAEAVVVYEVPLLAESSVGLDCDLVVVAEAPLEQRVDRMVRLRGMSERDARNRIANQAGDAERRAIADAIIDTSGAEADTLAQVDALWCRITSA
ncbi:MAG: dephospho-CoA kinase [Leucobacter sp.]